MNSGGRGAAQRQDGSALLLGLLLALLGVFAWAGVLVWSTGAGPDTPVFWQLLAHPAVTTEDDLLFAHRDVPAGAPHPWPDGPPLRSPALDALMGRAASQGLRAALIVQGGRVTFERYFRGAGRQTRFPSFSVSKGVVGLLTGAALQAGQLRSLDDPVDEYVTALRGDPRGRLTVRQLLSMTSGLQATGRRDLWAQLTSADPRLYYGANLLDAVRRTPLEAAPGGHWAYSNAAVALLGLVLTRATGQSLSGQLSGALWRPLGAEAPATWSLDRPGGQEKAFAGLSATARDYARLGELVLRGGRWQGQSLVPAAFLQEATTPLNTVDTDPGDPPASYGLLFWLYAPARVAGQVVTAYPTVTFEGYLGQLIAVVPALDAVIVLLNDSDDTGHVSLPTALAVARDVLHPPEPGPGAAP